MNGNVYSGNVSRAASRSSSVNSTPGKVPPLKLKLPKSEKKDGRGYNPAAVNYKESEYHYGSDFEEDDEEEVNSKLSFMHYSYNLSFGPTKFS